MTAIHPERWPTAAQAWRKPHIPQIVWGLHKPITRPLDPPPHTLPSDPRAGSDPGIARLVLDKLAVTLNGKAAYQEARRRLGLDWHPRWHSNDALRPTGKILMETTVQGIKVSIGARTYHDSQGIWRHEAYITNGTTIDTGDFGGVWDWWHRENRELRSASWTFAAHPILDAACMAKVAANLARMQGVR